MNAILGSLRTEGCYEFARAELQSSGADCVVGLIMGGEARWKKVWKPIADVSDIS